MELEYLQRLRHGLALDRAAGSGSGSRLVRACVEALDVTGAGIMLMVEDEHRGTFGSSDATSDVVEELQFTLGEGPCIDTYRTGRPVAEPDLAHPAEARWPGFAEPALAAGAVAVFAFPLLVGRSRLGALDLYLDRPGDLRPEQYVDAEAMAEVAAHAILDLQADARAGRAGVGARRRSATPERGPPGLGHGVGATRHLGGRGTRATARARVRRGADHP